MLATLDVKADEARIVTEVTIYADKICVDEEIVRLKSHVKAMQDALSNGGACGRKLGFHSAGDEQGGQYHPLQSPETWP